MKENIHPEYHQARVTCACGASYETASTKGTFSVDVCANCHPFYTGKQKELSAKGQVDKFNRRYAAKGKAPAAG
jgi:large subunit ribosomal protein L31